MFRQEAGDLRNRVPDRDAEPVAESQPVRRVGRLVRVEHDERRAGRQGAEHVVDRQVEVERADADESVARSDAEPLVAVGHHVDHAAVADHDALGLAGGARRVQHVGEIIRARVGMRLEIGRTERLGNVQLEGLDLGRRLPVRIAQN